MPFGLVGSKNREVPMANERVEQAMRVRNLTRHYGRVRHAQPATDHGEPTDHIGRRLTELPHMRYNAKKAQVEGERYHTIEYQNALLLEKMRKIMYLGTAASNNGHHETGHPDEVMPRSLNAGSRRRELRKITEQNLGIVHRIQGRASEYERRRWEGERRHTEEILDRIARKPRPEFARSMPSLSAAPSASPGTDALVEALADAEPLAVRSPAGPPSPPPLAAGARAARRSRGGSSRSTCRRRAAAVPRVRRGARRRRPVDGGRGLRACADARRAVAPPTRVAVAARQGVAAATETSVQARGAARRGPEAPLSRRCRRRAGVAGVRACTRNVDLS